MKNKYFTLLIIPLLIISSLSPTIEAFFPTTHTYLIKETCEKNINSEFSRLCCNDIEACIDGSIMVDVSIIFYLEKGLKKYSVTHSDIFCREAIAMSRNPKEEAFASGMCLHQMSADTISHNILIPYSISKTGLPNVIIHPFAEQKIDNYINEIDPSAKVLLKNSMKNADDYVDFMQRVLQPNSEYSDVNVKQLTDAFILQVRDSDSGYDVSFQTLKAIPIYFYAIIFFVLLFSLIGIWFIVRKKRMNFWTIFGIIYLLLISLIILLAIIMVITGTIWEYFTLFASPISSFVPTPDEELIIKNSLDFTSNTFKYGIDYVKTLPFEFQDATGSGSIKKAEDGVQTIRLIYITIILVIHIIFVYFIFKSKNRKVYK